jgi:hypothetical protein
MSAISTQHGCGNYWIVRLIEPELVTCCVKGGVVELDPPPLPQPILRATVTSRTNPKQAVSHIPRAAPFLLMNPRGSRRIGSKKAAPVTVSVKTTVI